MANPYIYSVSADMPSGAVNEEKLHAEIVASAIATTLTSVRADMDVLTITFTGDLSAGDKTILDGDTTGPAGGLLAAHDNTAYDNGNALQYSSNSGQSIPALTLTTIDFEDHNFGDNDGRVTIGASWVFTAPIAGRYQILALIEMVATSWLAGEILLLWIRINGSMVTQKEMPFHAAINVVQSMDIADLLNLAEGDTVDVQFYHTHGSAVDLVNISNRNKISIIKQAGAP